MLSARPLLLAAALSACAPAPAAPEDDMNRMEPQTADTTLGLTDGQLSRCPDMPNCVCSQHPDDADHAIAPLAYTSEADAAWARLVSVLEGTPRVEILQNERPYLHARFTTLIMRFEDDVEFVLDEDASVVHVRSASRLGYSDLGKNRKRVEALRARFEG